MEDGKVSAVYIPPDENPMDIFTMPLVKIKFWRFVELLGLQLIDDKVDSKQEHPK